MLLFVCRKATSFNPVKLETSLTVILPPPYDEYSIADPLVQYLQCKLEHSQQPILPKALPIH